MTFPLQLDWRRGPDMPFAIWLHSISGGGGDSVCGRRISLQEQYRYSDGL